MRSHLLVVASLLGFAMACTAPPAEPRGSTTSKLESCQSRSTFRCDDSTVKYFVETPRAVYTLEGDLIECSDPEATVELVNSWSCEFGCNDTTSNCNPVPPPQTSPPSTGGDDVAPPQEENMKWSGSPDEAYSCGQHSMVLSAKAGHYVPTFCQWNGNNACAHAVRIIRSSDCTRNEGDTMMCCAAE